MSVSFISIVGLLAVVSSGIRLLPQIIKGHRIKSVRDVSMSWEIIGAISAFLWLWYGLLAADNIVMWSGVVIGLGYITLMYQHVLYE